MCVLSYRFLMCVYLKSYRGQNHFILLHVCDSYAFIASTLDKYLEVLCNFEISPAQLTNLNLKRRLKLRFAKTQA